MKKKSIIAAVIMSVLLSFSLSWFIKDQIDIQLSGKQGLVITDLQAINHVIDFYVDSRGNYYYLDYNQKNTYLYKVSNTGEQLFKKKLPTQFDGKQQFYTKIVVDEKDQIYLTVVVAGKKDRIIEREWIRKFDADGSNPREIFEIVHTEEKKMDNPFSASSGRLIQLQYFNNKLYVFDQENFNEIALYSLDLGTNNLRVEKEKILRLDSNLLREIIITAREEIYLLNRHADIYRISSADYSVEKVNTSYNGNERVIPHTISSDEEGFVYFTDVYNEYIVKINPHTLTAGPVFQLSEKIDGTGSVELGDLRNIKKFSSGQLSGHTHFGLDGNALATYYPNQTGTMIDRVQISAINAFFTYGVWFLGIIIASFLIVISVNIFRGKLGLVAKQIMIFVPIFLIVMFALILYLTNEAKQATIDAEYEKLTTVVEKTAKLMDGDLFTSINMPAEDFGEDFMEIVRQVNVGDGVIYYITYLIENGQIYVAVSNSFQSYTPIEYIFDAKTAQSYYDTLAHDKTTPETTMDSLGEWMFAMTTIKDSKGNIVGILEHGMDAGQIDEDINAAARQLTLLMVGIALTIALAYLIMLKYSLRALSILKTSVAEVASGQWDTKVDIRTKDEFRDIGQAFNRMSDHIQDHIKEITQLNKAYVKFVPEEIFKLLGKKSILDVKLGEQVTADMTMMFVNLRNIEEQTKLMDKQENYQFVNQVLEIIVKTVSENNGVVERFEGAGAISLFKNKAEDALLAGLRIMEEINLYNEQHKQHIQVGISINTGPVLLGIVGHEERMATTVISDELTNTYALETISAKTGANLLVAASTFTLLDKSETYSYRYIGKVQDKNSSKSIELYEFLDSYAPDVRNSKRMTRDMLELGVRLYQAGDFIEARKQFIRVIRADRNDQLAKTYLFLCEKYNQQSADNHEGILEYF
ncbi:adenylate/guanylate cyclase domain-containing protein [Desulfuribacillus alkaliarsenatis]|uniref:HAMP domain-containing protein n=1 Tax=Desulfuribacillus alkaliarsenatis TaxID=766136 RepID=A0A1E5G2L0_9FIRM|nr:adenylate/guanylate cyclase domain-containing protein [Desulfuribacillus alkaliarsenatis]OEF97123.1 hypothetical protein BHF68_05875 [Desulfuribacillus alkaliarsenatis]